MTKNAKYKSTTAQVLVEEALGPNYFYFPHKIKRSVKIMSYLRDMGWKEDILSL